MTKTSIKQTVKQLDITLLKFEKLYMEIPETNRNICIEGGPNDQRSWAWALPELKRGIETIKKQYL